MSNVSSRPSREKRILPLRSRLYKWVWQHGIARCTKSVKLRSLLKYGTRHPGRISLAIGENSIHVDPLDRRVRELLLPASVGRDNGKLNQVYWQRICERMSPSVVLDIGANYGENAFCVNYPAGTRVFLFEANPRLIPYLEKSRAEHPSCDQMTICPQAVSDSDGQTLRFYIDTFWSGTSSLLPGIHQHKGHEKQQVEVRTTTIDTVVLDAIELRDTLFFKMDIEGAEPLALAGMQETVAAFDQVVGWMEYDPEFLFQLQLAPADHFASLQKQFAVYGVIDISTVIPVENAQALSAIQSPTDLLLIKPGRQADARAVIELLGLRLIW